MSPDKAKVVDVHIHTLTPELARQINELVPSDVSLDLKKKVKRTPDGFEVPLHTEEDQIAEADKGGVDVMVVSIQKVSHIAELPSSTEARVLLSQTINEYLASMCRRYPERFMAFADIPVGPLGQPSIDVMHQALGKLGLHGINLWSSHGGKPLDVQEYREFFEEANRLKAVIFIHPTCRMEESLKDYHMFIHARFPYETTLTMTRLAYSGMLARYPDISFILSHAGGTIPFLWWRLDYGFREDCPSCRDHIQEVPSHYLKRCYYDTALCDSESLMLAYKRVGAGHMIFGTDTPYCSDSFRQTAEMVQGMGVSDGDKSRIMGGNLLDLLKRKS
ncbi:MAG: amidohydrolase [Chloroflexi bacterium]|nr:amidohydrolase [Chloroflexota bacterium]